MSDAKKKKGTMIFCVSALCISWFFIIRTLFPSSASSKYIPTLDRCVGEALAMETGRIVGEQGKIVLITRPNEQTKNLVSQSQLEGFEQGLQQYKGIKILATEHPKLVVVRGPMGGLSGLPEDFFYDVIDKHPDADVIVSFLGLPRFTNIDELEAEAARNKNAANKGPQIVAFGIPTRGVSWSTLIRIGKVGALVMPNPSPAKDEKPRTKTGTCSVILESNYAVVTEANLDNMVEKFKQSYPNL